MLQKGLSGIVGLVHWFSPFQIILANRILANQIATWSHVHRKTRANLVGKSLTCKRFCLYSTFEIKFCTCRDIRRMTHSICRVFFHLRRSFSTFYKGASDSSRTHFACDFGRHVTMWRSNWSELMEMAKTKESTQSYQTALSVAILLAEVVGWERDY